MLVNRQQLNQTAEGQHIQQAGESIYNLTLQLPEIKHRESAIEKVLAGLYDVTESQGVTFAPLDTQAYTIPEKVLHNKLKIYSASYDEFLEIYSLIQHQINNATFADPRFTLKVIKYIQGVYRKTVNSVRDSQEDSDWVIEKMFDVIQQDLRDCGATITLEEMRAVEYVIFYVFAECKIFEKPPIKSK